LPLIKRWDTGHLGSHSEDEESGWRLVTSLPGVEWGEELSLTSISLQNFS
jgi:hypothetical protein